MPPKFGPLAHGPCAHLGDLLLEDIPYVRSSFCRTLHPPQGCFDSRLSVIL